MLNLQSTTWIRFGVWLLIGLVIYFVYSRRRSRLARVGDGQRDVAQRRTAVGAGTSG